MVTAYLMRNSKGSSVTSDHADYPRSDEYNAFIAMH